MLLFSICYMIKLNVFIVVFLGLLSFTNCSIPANSQEEVSAKKQNSTKDTIPVTVIEVQLGSFAQELVANGKIVAAQKALVPFKVQAQINKVYVCDGQKVNKGQLLAEMDAFENKKQLDDNKVNFEKVTIELEDYLMGHGYTLKDTAAIPSHVFKIAKMGIR